MLFPLADLSGMNFVFGGQFIDGLLVFQGFKCYLRFELSTARFTFHFTFLNTTWFLSYSVVLFMGANINNRTNFSTRQIKLRLINC